MAAGAPPPFRLEYVPRVKEQLRPLSARARGRGVHQEFIRTLKAITGLLSERPGEWGDPLYDTHLEGGRVFRGLYGPLLVHYAVYETARLVVILDIDPYPNSHLAEPDS